jgi:hypothetical protein
MTVSVSPKDPAEKVPILFDYTLQLADGETLATASVTVTTELGTDATPAAMLSGTAIINGAKVTQWLIGGVNGVLYHLRCSVTTSAGATLVLAALMQVANA